MTIALWGTLLLVGKQPLLSESLSHASYPGLLLGAFLGTKILGYSEAILPIILCGCFAAILGYVMIVLLETKLSMHRDSALCFVLVAFFSMGVILASYVKACCPLLYNRINAYLYGQAATLGYAEAQLAACVFFLSVITLWWWYRQIVITLFDKDYASTCGVRTHISRAIILVFVSLVIVSGVRSVGVVLISSMFVAPSLAARQLSDRLRTIFILSAVFGGLCGALGCYLSVAVTCHVHSVAVALPTGPLIVVISGCWVFLCLLFSPKSGWVIKYIRKQRFSFSKGQEHVLKVFWYLREENIVCATMDELRRSHRCQEYFRSLLLLRCRMWMLTRCGLLQRCSDRWSLTPAGIIEAEKSIRAHRLWESYLVRSLDFDEKKVHEFAEEIEHVLTDELDNAITEILDNPHYDPHNRLIPGKHKKGRG